MTRRDYWLGVGAICVVVLLHAAFPRYEWRELLTEGGRQFRPFLYARFDRWTGQATVRPYAMPASLEPPSAP